MGCSSNVSFNSEPIPLSDGKQLTYAVILDSEGKHIEDSYMYTFNKSGDNWHVTETSGNYMTGNKEDFTIDPNCVITDSDKSWQVGKKFYDIWLPGNMRTVGTHFYLSLTIDDYTIGEKTFWNGHSVWPAVSLDEQSKKTAYYDAESGWLLGVELTLNDGSKRTDTLTS